MVPRQAAVNKKGRLTTAAELRKRTINTIVKSAQTLLDKDKLQSLQPFTDQDGILRVGGRLQQSNHDIKSLLGF